MSNSMNRTSWKSETNADISESEWQERAGTICPAHGLLSLFHIRGALQTL